MSLVQIASDNFTRANENPLAAPWEQFASGSSFCPLQLYEDAVYTTDTIGDGLIGNAIYTDVSWTDDQGVQFTVPAAGITALIGGVLRSQNDGQSAYWIVIEGGLGSDISWSILSGTLLDPSDLYDGTITSFSANDTFLAEVIGSTIYFYQNEILLGQVDDSTYSSGSAGIFVSTESEFDTSVTNWIGYGSSSGGLTEPTMSLLNVGK